MTRRAARAAKPKPRVYVLTVTVRSATGAPPTVRTIGGDAVFCALAEGMTARWTLRANAARSKGSTDDRA